MSTQISVYNALSDIVFEEKASKEDIVNAVNLFFERFYIEEIEEN